MIIFQTNGNHFLTMLQKVPDATLRTPWVFFESHSSVWRDSAPNYIPLETSSEATFGHRSSKLTGCNYFLLHMAECLKSPDATADTMLEIKNISWHNLKQNFPWALVLVRLLYKYVHIMESTIFEHLNDKCNVDELLITMLQEFSMRTPNVASGNIFLT